MSDLAPVLPLFVHTFTKWGPTVDIRGVVANGSQNVLSTNWTANLSSFVPISIPWDYPVNRVFWVNGSTGSSNANFGIFSRSGKRIYATGSTAQSGTSVPQFVTPTPFVLPAGEYFFAWACDGTSNRSAGTTPLVEIQKLCGVQQQASNFALADPSSPTTATVAIMPYCGVTRTVSGF